MNTQAQFLQRAVSASEARHARTLVLLARTMDTAAAFAFDCGRLGVDGAAQAHLEALEILENAP